MADTHGLAINFWKLQDGPRVETSNRVLFGQFSSSFFFPYFVKSESDVPKEYKILRGSHSHET